jgi:hypothetical protein
MKPAFCAGIVVQLSISRKRAMKSCHPAESGTLRAKLGSGFREHPDQKWLRIFYLHPYCTLQNSKPLM